MNNMQENNAFADAGARQGEAAQGIRRFRPKLTFYHPKPSGNGSAIELELHPAHDDTDGSIWARMARQISVGDRTGNVPVYPRFGWEEAITVKLDFSDLAQMMMVFRGECESLADGKGLLHSSPKGITRIALRHVVEQFQGYSLEFYRTSGKNEYSSRIFLSPYEACGLAAAIENSFGVICFGIPMVIQRDTAAYRSAARKIANEPAA
jgi:hypothetical protein